MNICLKLLLLVILLSPASLQAALTDEQVFAYVEALFPALFPLPATSGHYLQYHYRHYPASNNYFAVDSAGDIYVMGPFTGNAITLIGPVASFETEILAWEATKHILKLVTMNAVCVVSKPCNVPLVERVSGGTPPYHFQQDTFANGTRPLNTNIDLINGNISGTPSQVETATFRLCAVDLVADQDCQSVTVTVNRNTEITANPGAVAMKANYCYPAECTVAQTIEINSTTPWTSSPPGFGSLGTGFTVSPDSGPAGTSFVTISYSASVPMPADGFIRFRSSQLGIYAEVAVVVTTL